MANWAALIVIEHSQFEFDQICPSLLGNTG
jgi:hypothetical protein